MSPEPQAFCAAVSLLEEDEELDPLESSLPEE